MSPKVLKIPQSILIIGIMILPLWFLPFTENYYETNIWLLLTVLALITLITAALELIASEKISISFSPTGAGLLALALASGISSGIIAPNKFASLYTPLGVGTYLCIAIILIFGKPLLTHRQLGLLKIGAVIIAGVSGLIVIYQQLGLGKMLMPNAVYLHDTLWTPIGTPIAFLVFACLMIPTIGHMIAVAWKEKHELAVGIFTIIAIILGIGIGLTVWRFLPKISTSIMSMPMAWNIMLETWKTWKSALFGVSADNFIQAFTMGKPLWVNMTSYWNINFGTSATTLFHNATIFGLCGLIATIYLGFQLIKGYGKGWQKIYAIIAITLILLAPPSLMLYISLMIMALTNEQTKVWTGTLKTWNSVGIALFIGVVILSSGYGLSRWYMSEITFNQALNAIRENNGTKAYTLEASAIKLNPYNGYFREMFAQTNLSMVSSFLASIKKDEKGAPVMTDEEKQTITSLISQAIREGKNATSLNPTSVIAWATLGAIYQNLMGVAADADTWAIASYQKALALDPSNPVLYLDMGGIYMSGNKYEEAMKQFMTAAQVKPNYPNAFYNIANIWRLSRNKENAKKTLNQVRQLIQKTVQTMKK